ncbi:MAG: ABC transporter permease, partial [Bryobacteraceae bacterium]
GANTAIFSVVNSVVFRPLSFADPDRLMVVMDRRGEAPNLTPVAPANYEDTRSRTRMFQDLAAAEAWHGIFTGDGAAERVQGLRVTANLFPMLGVQPLLGRAFTREEEEIGRHRALLLSYGLWQRRFGGDAGIVGRTVQLSGQPFQIVGVMPHGFAFPPFWASKAEMWAPLAFDQERRQSRAGSSLRLFGRLRPSVTLKQAQAEMNAIAAGLAREFPESNKDRGAGVRPLHEMVVGDVRPGLLLLSGAVGFLLLIACCNVANLLLVRSLKRQREMAVRAALGASRWRVTRQLLAESVVVSLFGGFAGIILAFWGMDALVGLLRSARSLNITELPRLEEIALDTGALLFTLALSLLTGLLFGIAPAFQSMRLAVGESLKESALSTSGSTRGVRLRNAFVISEVALTVVLLAGAGLMIRSFIKLLEVHPGFEPDRVLAATVSVTGTSVEQPERQAGFYRLLLEQVRSLPGVLSAAAINHLPLAGDRWSTSYVVEGRPEPSPADRPAAIYRMISPGYFRTIGTTLLRGRDFNGQDTANSEKVVVVNDTLAGMLSPGKNVLGMRIRTGGSPEWQTIIGVAENVRQKDWIEETSAEIYQPFVQHPSHFAG